MNTFETKEITAKIKCSKRNSVLIFSNDLILELFGDLDEHSNHAQGAGS